MRKTKATLFLSAVVLIQCMSILITQYACRNVHFEGISPDNDMPIKSDLGKVLPNGMNLGNVSLYHVENGKASKMDWVFYLKDADEHNEFYYDPATGSTSVVMASFSEIALVSDAEKTWEGVVATAFAGGAGTSEDPS